MTETRKRLRNLSNQPMMDHGMLPPQAIEIEEAVLGAIMMFPAAMDNAMMHLKDTMFYKEMHNIKFSAAVQLLRENKPVDLLTVTNKLKSTGKL